MNCVGELTPSTLRPRASISSGTQCRPGLSTAETSSRCYLEARLLTRLLRTPPATQTARIGRVCKLQMSPLSFPGGWWRWRQTAHLQNEANHSVDGGPALRVRDPPTVKKFRGPEVLLRMATTHDRDLPIFGVIAIYRRGDIWARDFSPLSQWRGPFLPHTER